MSCKEFNTKPAEIIIKDIKWKYDLSSLSISKNIAGESSAIFTLTFIDEDIKPIEVGTPVFIYMYFKGVRNLVFGGIISNLSSEPIRNGYKKQLFLNVECAGFSKILERRNTFFYLINPIKYKEVVENIVNILGDDGITKGIIEGSENIPSDFEFEGGSFGEFLDELADLIGYIWYVDQNRKLYFVKEYPSSVGNYYFITKNDYQLELSSRNDNNYYNKVIVKSQNFHIVLEDTTEITKRKGLFGSGVFGKILREKEIETPESAKTLAENFLYKHSYNRQEFNIITSELIDLNKEFNINWQGFIYKVIATEIQIIQKGELVQFVSHLEYKPPSPKQLKYSFWKDQIKGIITTNSNNQKQVKGKQPKFIKVINSTFQLTSDDSEALVMIECSYSVPKDGKGDVEIYIDNKFIGSIRTGTVSANDTKTFKYDLKKGVHKISGMIEQLSTADINDGFVANRLNNIDFFVFSENLKITTKNNRINLLDSKKDDLFTNGTSAIKEIDGNIFLIY